MKQTDNGSNTYTFITAEDIAEFKTADMPGKRRIFLNYVRRILKACKTGDIDIHEAGYQIAGAMFMFDALDDDPLFEEITATAGALELPAGVVETSPYDLWTKLQALTKEYAEAIRLDS